MLSHADRALAARDPRLLALPVLLDPAALREWLSDLLGTDLRVAARYVRYKPGTSAVAAVQVSAPDDRLPAALAAAPATADGSRTLVVTGYGPDGVRKLDKTADRAPGGSVLAIDRPLTALVGTVTADRDLPAVMTLADPVRATRLLRRAVGDSVDLGTDLRQLAYKPHRRWVGALRSDGGAEVLLRAYRPGDVRAVTDRARALARAGSATPRLLGRHTRSGLAVLEYRPGTALDPAAPADQLTAAGAALGALHATAADLSGRDPRDDLAAARRTARQVTMLAPELGERVTRLTAALEQSWGDATGGRQVTLHGDFSLDQVVRSHEGVALIDLDHAALGPAEVDVASLAAQAVLHGAADPGDLIAGVLAGYPEPLDGRRLGVHLAAQLLRRAAEPFRAVRPDWRGEVEAVIGRVEHLLLHGRTVVAP